jgi:hypothetical protein
MKGAHHATSFTPKRGPCRQTGTPPHRVCFAQRKSRRKHFIALQNWKSSFVSLLIDHKPLLCHDSGKFFWLEKYTFFRPDLWFFLPITGRALAFCQEKRHRKNDSVIMVPVLFLPHRCGLR